MSTLTHLECSLCGETYDAGQVQNLCRCGGPLLARYDLEKARETWPRESLRDAPSNMWRYAPVLPVRDGGAVTSLGEGWTPLVWTERLGRRLGATGCG